MSELELVDRDRQPVLPITGEIINLRDATQVAHALDQVREGKRQLDELRALFELILRAEAERQGTKTLHLGPYEAVVSGGERTEYDVEELEAMLIEAGLPEDRLNQLITRVITYKVNHAVAKQLRSINPNYARALDAASHKEPVAWRVSVKRERS